MVRTVIVSMLVCYWAVIFLGTHLPGTLGALPRINDKILHLGAYAGLGFLLSAALTAYGLRRGTLIITLALAALYGCFDELTQLLVRGRQAELADWAADVFGAGLGGVAFAIAILILARRFPNTPPSTGDAAAANDAS